MSIQMTTTFSIEEAINPSTNQPFGKKYAGVFSLKRPSLDQKIRISGIENRMLKERGFSNPNEASAGEKYLMHAFAYISVTATEPLPEWFDLGKMYDDSDEDAIIAVWEEVGKFLDTFRPGADS